MVKHRVALSGSYSGHNIENLFDKLSGKGILQFSLIGRELTLQVKSESLDDMRKNLGKLGVDNVSIVEWRKCGMTLSNSGSGEDMKGLLNISLIPSALGEDLRNLAVLCEVDVGKRVMNGVQSTVKEILREAGVTDVLYTIQFRKKARLGDYLKASELATINALFDSGGVVGIENG